MGEMLEQLEKYFEETPQEVQDQHFHEIMCDIYGIDHTLPNAKKLLKRKQRRYKWRNNIWPHIRNVIIVFLMVWLLMYAGYWYGTNGPVWIIILDVLGGLGWFNIFIQKNYNRW